jgi:hypothetical protein
MWALRAGNLKEWALAEAGARGAGRVYQVEGGRPLRQSSFAGLRDEKDALLIVRE